MVDAMPASLQASDAGIAFGPDGGVSIGPEFRELEDAWTEGIAAMAGGARIIVDEVFLSGGGSAAVA
ncbi:Chloramphenicol 3-O phosphotransferase OS=Streptomyces microflavus OX=1919 GN=Smic_46390 PE=4 SV=1 [Streptomyces microflavus]